VVSDVLAQPCRICPALLLDSGDPLFEPGFVQALVSLGEHDAYARKAELLAFSGERAA